MEREKDKKAHKVLPRNFDTSDYPKQVSSIRRQSIISARDKSELSYFSDGMDKAITPTIIFNTEDVEYHEITETDEVVLNNESSFQPSILQ